MKIEVSGHHVDISSAVISDIQQKFTKIDKHYPNLLSVGVILSKQNNEHHVELSTMYEGGKLASHGKDRVLYPAVNNAIKKLESALSHRKGQLAASLRKESAVTSPTIVHEHIQDLDLN